MSSSHKSSQYPDHKGVAFSMSRLGIIVVSIDVVAAKSCCANTFVYRRLNIQTIHVAGAMSAKIVHNTSMSFLSIHIFSTNYPERWCGGHFVFSLVVFSTKIVVEPVKEPRCFVRWARPHANPPQKTDNIDYPKCFLGLRF